MSNKTYDVLKFIALVLLPAIGTLYFALAGIWGLPYAEQIVGTITAIDTFLGVLVKYWSDKYNKTVENIQQGYNIDHVGLYEDAEEIEYEDTDIETEE